MLLDGMHLPLTTPFFADGRLNLRKLEQNVARYSLTPAAGLVVLGESGEANLLTDAEWGEVLRVAVGSAAATKVMLAGVSCDGVAATLERIGVAAALGYDAVLVGAPRFAGVATAEQRVYLWSVADRSPLPIVLRGPIEGSLLHEMAFHARVLGYVHDSAATGDIEALLQKTAGLQRTVTVTPVFAAVTRRMQAAQAAVAAGDGVISAASLEAGGRAVASLSPVAAVKTRTKKVGFQVLAGGTERLLPALLAGAVGTLPGLAAAAPQACYEVLAAWKDGDPALAEEKQARLIGPAQVVEGLGAAGLKYGCDLNGYFGGSVRLPKLPLVEGQRDTVARILEGLRS